MLVQKGKRVFNLYPYSGIRVKKGRNRKGRSCHRCGHTFTPGEKIHPTHSHIYCLSCWEGMQI